MGANHMNIGTAYAHIFHKMHEDFSPPTHLTTFKMSLSIKKKPRLCDVDEKSLHQKYSVPFPDTSALGPVRYRNAVLSVSTSRSIIFRQSNWFLACIGLFLCPFASLMAMTFAIHHDFSVFTKVFDLIKLAKPHEIGASVTLYGFFLLLALALGKCFALFGSHLT